MRRRRRVRLILPPEPDGWAILKTKRGGVISIHPTREEAIEVESARLAERGGGQIRVIRVDGRRPERVKVKPSKKHATPVS